MAKILILYISEGTHAMLDLRNPPAPPLPSPSSSPSASYIIPPKTSTPPLCLLHVVGVVVVVLGLGLVLGLGVVLGLWVVPGLGLVTVMVVVVEAVTVVGCLWPPLKLSISPLAGDF